MAHPGCTLSLFPARFFSHTNRMVRCPSVNIQNRQPISTSPVKVSLAGSAAANKTTAMYEKNMSPSPSENRLFQRAVRSASLVIMSLLYCLSIYSAVPNSARQRTLLRFTVMCHSDDDIPLFVSCLDIPVRLGRLFQRIASIYD